MEIFSYTTILFILMFLLTIARYHVVSFGNSDSIILKYSPIGIFNLVLSYLFFMIFTIFRSIDFGMGGTDANAYKIYFHNAGGNIIDSINSQPYELGYAFIIWFTRTISEDYRVALFIIYSLMFLLLVNFIKYISWSKYTPITIFLLLTLWLTSFNITRSILALFIGTFVYTLLFKRKYKTAILVAIIATTIHSSALVLLLMIAVVIVTENRSRFSLTKLILLNLFLSLAFIMCIRLFELILIKTGNVNYISLGEGDVALGTVVIVTIVFILGLFKYSNLVNINSYNKVLFIMLPVCIPIFILQINFAIFYRMMLFFLPILFILIPDLIRVISIKRVKDMIVLPIKLGLFSYLIYRIYIFLSAEIDHVGIPYINDLFKF